MTLQENPCQPPAAQDSTSKKRRGALAAIGLPIVLAFGLYSRTFYYDLTGDDFCLLERARDSGPWRAFFIGPGTLKDVLETEEWRGQVVVDGSDVFRPGLIWYFKLGWALFGKWDAGYRILKFAFLVAFIFTASQMAARFAGVGAEWFAASAACLLLINDSVQWITTMQCCEAATFAMAAATCAGVLAHDRWQRTRRGEWLAAAAGLMAFGLCNRENALAMPLMAAALDFAEGRRLRSAWAAWAAYALTAAAYFLIRLDYYNGTLGHYMQIGSGADALARILRISAYSPIFLPRCVIRASTSRIAPYEAFVPVGAVLLLAVGAGRGMGRRLVGMVAAAFASFGPGYMMGFTPQHLVMPAALFIGLALALSSAAYPQMRSKAPRRWLSAGGTAFLWGTYVAISLSIYFGWSVATKQDVRTQRIRREIRDKVIEIAAQRQERQLVILLLAPINMRFNLFENTFAPAVRFWTDGRCEGHTVFIFYPRKQEAPCKLGLVRLKPFTYAARFTNLVFTPPQVRFMGSKLESDFARIEVRYGGGEDDSDYALVELSEQYAGRFAAVHVLAFDGDRLIECDKIIIGP